MNISCIIVFSNDDRIIHKKRRHRKSKIGWVISRWTLVNINNKYKWEQTTISYKVTRPYILNYDKRKIYAKKMSKHLKLLILYRKPDVLKRDPNIYIGFRESDLDRMRFIKG